MWFFDGFTHSHQIGHWVEISGATHAVAKQVAASALLLPPLAGVFVPKLPGPMTEHEKLFLGAALAPLGLDVDKALMYVSAVP